MADSASTINESGCAVPTEGQPFDFEVRLGLSFIVQAACFSALAVTGLLLYIAFSAIRSKRGGYRGWTMSTHVHWYFLSLMVSELIQAIGGILNVKWVKNSDVMEGATCTAQGEYLLNHGADPCRVLKQLGDVGVALASLAIAIHTFSVIVLRWRPKPTYTVAVVVISTIWLFLILTIAISLGVHRGKDYYGDTQYWCWITQAYPGQRIALEYFWMWMAAFMNILLYIPITLVLKGFMTVSGWRVRFLSRSERRHVSQAAIDRDDIDHIAVKMLFYPLIYTCTVLPIAIVRWRAFSNRCVPWAATVVAGVIFASSGLLNVLLFTTTRPTLLPSRERNDHTPRSLRFGPRIHSSVISISSPSASAPPGLSGSSTHAGTISTIPDELDNGSLRLDTPKNSIGTILDDHTKFQAFGSSPSLTLKLQRDKVRQYQKKIQGVLDREHELAKQYLAEGRKDRAIFALRKRKFQETLLTKTDGQLENLEQLVSTIEFSLIEVSVLHGLQQGNEALKEIHKVLNVDSVEKLLEETAVAREHQREIDEMLANNLTVEDEEAVQAELKELEREALGETAPLELPSVPTEAPTEPEDVESETDKTPVKQERERERIPVAA
ncbi:hypothetical protein NLI96_g991 [Meripilus lineatus]|uniref:Glucose receptor Git3 N-terminal domain-containing protein n=1 Tax=Meripilus lineatus TaxID=2056292 RepID=A0AAD5VDN2_9APHY|nr:hypothetical protein NLI96_g991 [Physisporinus lineatus]